MKFFFTIVLLSLSSFTYAVDGYKNMKFGASKWQMIDSGLCEFQEAELINIEGFDSLVCGDFMLGQNAVEAAAFFINERFLRFVIEVPLDSAEGVMHGLIKKYGNASSSSSEQELLAVDKYPNRVAMLAFDNDTIILRLESDANNEQSAVLIYTSPKYDQLIQRYQTESVLDSL